jgi:mannose-6-phosphate isomerase-like protein (cupin superfamily)
MLFNAKSTPEIEEILAAWQPYIATIDDWQKLTEGVMPKETYCGPVYEPGNPIDRTGESFAVADMRSVKVAEPHYHTGGETEIYFVLSGTGLTVVGGQEMQIQPGDVIVTPPETTHFTIPNENLVLVVINAPPFNPANNLHIDQSDPTHFYDHDQYKRLTQRVYDSGIPKTEKSLTEG